MSMEYVPERTSRRDHSMQEGQSPLRLLLTRPSPAVLGASVWAFVEVVDMGVGRCSAAASRAVGCSVSSLTHSQ